MYRANFQFNYSLSRVFCFLSTNSMCNFRGFLLKTDILESAGHLLSLETQIDRN